MNEFEKLTQEELELYNAKNADYTKGGEPMGNFHRVAKFFSQYPNLNISDPVIVAMVYMLKQLDAVLWMLNQGYEGGVEGVDDRLKDVHVYAKIARILYKEYKYA